VPGQAAVEHLSMALAAIWQLLPQMWSRRSLCHCESTISGDFFFLGLV